MWCWCVQAAVIVTGNARHFAGSSIPVMTPAGFLVSHP